MHTERSLRPSFLPPSLPPPPSVPHSVHPFAVRPSLSTITPILNIFYILIIGTHNNFIYCIRSRNNIQWYTKVAMPTPARALFAPTPEVISCIVQEIRKRKRLFTPHEKSKRILKRGGYGVGVGVGVVCI